jgi:hypothetical protein
MPNNTRHPGLGIALGAALGAALGVIAGNIGVWLAVGVAIGVAIGAGWRRKAPDCPHCAAVHFTRRGPEEVVMTAKDDFCSTTALSVAICRRTPHCSSLIAHSSQLERNSPWHY